MNEIDKKLGKLFRNRREAVNMTQLELSKLLNYESMQFVSLFERGLSKIPYQKIGEMFVIFEMNRKDQKQITDILEQQYQDELFKGILKGKILQGPKL